MVHQVRKSYILSLFVEINPSTVEQFFEEKVYKLRDHHIRLVG